MYIRFSGPKAKPGNIVTMSAVVNDQVYQLADLFRPEEEPHRQEHELRMFTELMQEVYRKEIKGR